MHQKTKCLLNLTSVIEEFTTTTTKNYLYCAIGREKDVPRLQIPMYEALIVDILDP